MTAERTAKDYKGKSVQVEKKEKDSRRLVKEKYKEKVEVQRSSFTERMHF